MNSYLVLQQEIFSNPLLPLHPPPLSQLECTGSSIGLASPLSPPLALTAARSFQATPSCPDSAEEEEGKSALATADTARALLPRPKVSWPTGRGAAAAAAAARAAAAAAATAAAEASPLPLLPAALLLLLACRALLLGCRSLLAMPARPGWAAAGVG